jgi:hypothetical protein
MRLEGTPMLEMDEILDRATTLARRCDGDRVPENLLAMVLSHLRRHRDVAETLGLLTALQKSPFRQRTKSTPHQFAKLKDHVTVAVTRTSWEEAAWIVGWARRLARSYGEGA